VTNKAFSFLISSLFPFYACLCVLVLSGCAEPGPIAGVLSADAPAIRAVMANPDHHEVQILFTEIVRTAGGEISFADDEYQVSDDFYHYPASTVKFPVALLALEKLSEDQRLNRYTRFQVQGEPYGSSVTNELIELFTVSDNQAFNRLFEFLGKDEINRRLRDKEIAARISHRLSVPDSDVLTTRAVTFSATTGQIVVGPTENQPIQIPSVSGLQKGIAYVEDNATVEAPFDFSEKNYLPLRSLHGVMKRLVIPEAFPESQRFQITAVDREFVLDAMSSYPREAGYDDAEYPDGYAKFLLLGDSSDRAPDRFTIHNKSGWAYGYLTDSAYIVDHERNREYIISASIHVNANQTFNDNVYEYEEIGVPFLAELGRQLVGM